MKHETARALRRSATAVTLAMGAVLSAACVGVGEGQWDDSVERATADLGDTCSAPDAGTSADAGTKTASAAAPRDAGTSADAGTSRDGGTRDGGPDAGSCSCPADRAWDGTAETVV